ncbi:hypothetical protein PI124_g22191 [Phytophthora idaei]|nr:hypothetical protein PI125_g23620 [Phytophthora idaei]KAG3123816.1 hypothetical protein PI126_g23535 [Phytophthora idaei]KAG3232728.1 hypothetical protein PI124_g22191 [Phytophthora idaei]
MALNEQETIGVLVLLQMVASSFPLGRINLNAGVRSQSGREARQMSTEGAFAFC